MLWFGSSPVSRPIADRRRAHIGWPPIWHHLVMRSSPITMAALAGALAVAGLLVGCGGSDENVAVLDPTTPVASTDAVTNTTTEVTESQSTDAPVETDPPATDPPPPVTEVAVDDGSCLVGNWVVTEAEMNGFYGALTSTLDAPITIGVVGSAPLSFGADGTYGWQPDFALTVEVAGQRGTGVTAGTITGNWSAVDGVVTTASDVNALTVSITIGGTTVNGADLTNGLLNSSPVNGVTYSCDGPTPVLDFQTADPAVTVPVTLTPA